MCRSPASPPTRSRASWATSPSRAPRTASPSGRSKGFPTRRSSTSTPRARRSGRGRSPRGSSPNTCCARSPGPSPSAGKRAITPFSEEDMKTLLANGERSRTYTRPGKRACDHAVATALRNRTIILLLLDTGVRASELPEGEPGHQGCRPDQWPKATCSASASWCWARARFARSCALPTLCDGVSRLPAHGQDAVALPDHRTLRRMSQSTRRCSWAARATRTFGGDALLKLLTDAV